MRKARIEVGDRAKLRSDVTILISNGEHVMTNTNVFAGANGICRYRCEDQNAIVVDFECVSLSLPEIYFVPLEAKSSVEHPLKTRLDDLKEKYPDVPLNCDGVPDFIPQSLGYCRSKTCGVCDDYRLDGFKSCWNMPLEEQPVRKDEPESCENCEYRRMIDGKYRCSTPVEPTYSCEHWAGDARAHMCCSCKHAHWDENGDCYCRAPLPEGHWCENWEDEENV